jgi:hypothetical protein
MIKCVHDFIKHDDILKINRKKQQMLKHEMETLEHEMELSTIVKNTCENDIIDFMEKKMQPV